MPDNQIITILVESIFYSKHAFTRWIKKYIFLTRWPIAEKKIKMFLRMKQFDVDVLDSLTIEYIQITDREKSYSDERTEEILMPPLRKNAFIYTKEIKAVFPIEGLYWIDAYFRKMPGIYFVMRQVTLSGVKGRGEIEHKENTCRNPIIVKDLSNYRLLIFTGILVLLTMVLAVDAIPRLIHALKSLF